MIRCKMGRTDVVRGGTKSAGDDDDLRPFECDGECFANGVAIGDGDLLCNAKPEREQSLSQGGHVGIDDAAQKYLRAGVDDFDDHKALRMQRTCTEGKRE